MIDQLTEAIKHLPGQHSQSTHAGMGRGGEDVSAEEHLGRARALVAAYKGSGKAKVGDVIFTGHKPDAESLARQLEKKWGIKRIFAARDVGDNKAEVVRTK